MSKRFDNALRGLRAQVAPASLAPAVYRALGLAARYARIKTPIGDVFVAYASDGVTAIRRCKDAAAFERWHAKRFGYQTEPAARPPSSVARAVQRRLAGDMRVQVPVDLRGVTPFERSVLEKTREIPRGQVRPYQWIARAIGKPRAVRAVGSALAHNPVPLVIPCHRVVRADGSIGNYIFGNAAKRTLLMSEGALG
jgi:O-6-methylguanine DNA methyltransferase